MIRAQIESNDPEFDDFHRQFTAIEQGTDKLIKDTKAYTEAVTCNCVIFQTAYHKVLFLQRYSLPVLALGPTSRSSFNPLLENSISSGTTRNLSGQ
jgi:hypothetical protein